MSDLSTVLGVAERILGFSLSLAEPAHHPLLQTSCSCGVPHVNPPLHTRCSYEGRRTYQLAMHRSAAQSPPSRLTTPCAGQVASPRLGPAYWHRISARVPWTSHRTDKSGVPRSFFASLHKSSSQLSIRLPPPFTYYLVTILSQSMRPST